MLVNYELQYDELEQKRVECAKMGVQIRPCRFRPLDKNNDGFRPHKWKGQDKSEYYIHPGWSDYTIRLFFKNVRRHNICIRSRINFHSSIIERKHVDLEERKKYIKMSYNLKKYQNKIDIFNKLIYILINE